MKKFVSLCLCVAGILSLKALEFNEIVLANEIKLPDIKVEKRGESFTVQLPGLPARAGYIPVLKCRMYSYAASESGCNYAARVSVNGNDLGRRTAAGRKRLLFRDDRFELTDPRFKGRFMPVFLTSTEFNLQFAPTADRADRQTTDGKGAQFILDLSDVARELDVNSVTFTNIRLYFGTPITLFITDASIGYLDRALLEEKETPLLQCSPASFVRQNGGMQLSVYKNGGFAFNGGNGETLVAESAFSMDPAAVSAMTASDSGEAPVTVREVTGGFCIEKSWGAIKLRRNLTLHDGMLYWEEIWSNTSSEIAAVPFRHRIGLNNAKARVWLRGTPDVFELLTIDGNSTIFMESMRDRRCGFGIVLEDDISRLICGGNSAYGMAEFYTGCFALAPGASRKLFYTVTPVSNNGYWEFINAVRRRWGIGRYGMDRPVFWAPLLPASAGKNWAERVRKIFGGFGPVTLAVDPWVHGLGKMEAIARCTNPDGNTEAVLAECHAKALPGLLDKLREIKGAIPGIKVYSLHHASMFCVYLPEFSGYRLFDSVIRGKDLQPYHHAGYDAAILKGAEKRNWAVAYCMPQPGNYSWQRNFELLDAVFAAGIDGVYYDEFGSCATKRDYSRYEYTQWDGFSADIDENGKVIALKADYSYLTLPFQNALIHRLSATGRGLLGNGAAVTGDMNQAPVMRFMEGASSNANMPGGHLSHIPLVLGNYGDVNSRAGIMAAVRTALKYGCVYSPFTPTALYLSGRDNFICKFYPLTITELGQGVICARERIITDHSGSFVWNGVDSGTAELFVYDASGNRLPDTGTVQVVDGKITLTCPENGLVIAELQR